MKSFLLLYFCLAPLVLAQDLDFKRMQARYNQNAGQLDAQMHAEITKTLIPYYLKYLKQMETALAQQGQAKALDAVRGEWGRVQIEKDLNAGQIVAQPAVLGQVQQKVFQLKQQIEIRQNEKLRSLTDKYGLALSRLKHQLAQQGRFDEVFAVEEEMLRIQALLAGIQPPVEPAAQAPAIPAGDGGDADINGK